jgi:hypothetical protein
MEVCLELEQKYKDSLIAKFLHHVEKVEADHDVKTDGDNTDYWNSMQLEDGSFVDYNFHMMSEWDDLDRSWTCEVYSVDPPTEDNEYHSINTDLVLLLAFYQPKTKKLEIDDLVH